VAGLRQSERLDDREAAARIDAELRTSIELFVTGWEPLHDAAKDSNRSVMDEAQGSQFIVRKRA
jgi:hypothetical protein